MLLFFKHFHTVKVTIFGLQLMNFNTCVDLCNHHHNWDLVLLFKNKFLKAIKCSRTNAVTQKLEEALCHIQLVISAGFAHGGPQMCVVWTAQSLSLNVFSPDSSSPFEPRSPPFPIAFRFSNST